MPATVIDDEEFRNKVGVFLDRDEAGRHLARHMEIFQAEPLIVLAIPAGGVPVGLEISSHLRCPFDLMIVRKVLIPGSSEASFGAMSLEGDLILNRNLARQYELNSKDISKLTEPLKGELEERNRMFRNSKPFANLKGKVAVIVDDGLVTGYTMVVAIRMVKKHKASKIIVAVPTAPLSAVKRIENLVDVIVCPNIRATPFFAVADAYQKWQDLTDNEVIELLKKSKFLPK